MEFQIAQISSLEKIRDTDPFPRDEIHQRKVLAGERFCYQICVRADRRLEAKVVVESGLSDCVTVYLVKNACMDMPVRDRSIPAEDYITLEPGLMPDILVPLKEQNDRLTVSEAISTLWVRVDVPQNAVPGRCQIRVGFSANTGTAMVEAPFELWEIMNLEIADAVMPPQRLIYTRWFYADCIAVQHNVEVYSEKHWELIGKYIAAAADMGINMILVPVHTPPLDTAVGSTRPCVQLVDIERKDGRYEFSFSRFHRFIEICKKNRIRYFEIAHMFSQWGARCAPNIMVTENGRTEYRFGWHVAADSPEYSSFLKQYIEAIVRELRKEGISENTYFHISDEPGPESMETYRRAAGILRPLIKDSRSFDALSDYSFYEKGLVDCPVTGVAHIHEFLEHGTRNQWVYYCCDPERVFPNCFLAMPSYRIRILGFLMYKYKIRGFLQWGFNFYNASVSRYAINPYLTTSGDKSFASGDPFIVYPGRDTVYSSIRGQVTYEAVQDMDICFALEERIGRDAVVALIDQAAGRNLRFDDYPAGREYPERLRAEMIALL